MARPQTPLSEAMAKTEAILNSYKSSGLTRKQYSAREGLSLSMLGYHQRRSRELRERQARQQSQPQKPAQKLLRVEVESAPALNATPPSAGFTLTLPKGRRIESGWNFAEEQLTRLIRAVEAA
jgi:hypothetical protein